MKKFRVTYCVTKYETYEVEAKNREDAMERFDEGNLLSVGEEDGNIQSCKEV